MRGLLTATAFYERLKRNALRIGEFSGPFGRSFGRVLGHMVPSVRHRVLVAC
jgi:hypothetical protein